MRKVVVRFLIASLIFCTINHSIKAEANEKESVSQIDQLNEVIKNLFSKDPSIQKQNLFSEKFLEKLPFVKVQEFLPKYIEECGDYIDYKKIGNEGKIKLNFSKATVDAVFYLENNKINSFWVGEPESNSKNINTVIEEFKKLTGEKSVTIRKNGKNIISYNSDKSMCSGSSFKLFVLDTLNKRIEKGIDSWDKVIHIKKEEFSIPTGFLQTWEDKSPVTLATLANLMISISDNTATDTLVYYIGRENIEKNMPEKRLPLVTTLELFKIKGALSSDKVNEYISKNLTEKHKFLDELKNVKKENIVFSKTPKFLDKVGWLFTTEELCQEIESLKGLPSLSINRALATQSWEYVAYKGGSELGALNMTYLLKKADCDDIYSISTTINNDKEDVNMEASIKAISKIISFLYNNKM